MSEIYDTNHTGTNTVSVIDRNNDIYIVACHKSNQPDIQFNLPGGRFNPDLGDNNPEDTAARALEFFTGLSAKKFKDLKNLTPIIIRTLWVDEKLAVADATIPALGFKGQTGHDFASAFKVGNIDVINSLFEKHASLGRSSPYLVNATDLELVVDNNNKSYVYSGKTTKFLKNSENIISPGCFHLVEASVKNARDLIFKNYGYNSFEDFCNKSYKKEFTFSRTLENALNQGILKTDGQNFEFETNLGEAAAKLFKSALVALGRSNFISR